MKKKKHWKNFRALDLIWALIKMLVRHGNCYVVYDTRHWYYEDSRGTVLDVHFEKDGEDEPDRLKGNLIILD